MKRAVVALIALTSIPLFAATRTWTGTTSGTWSDASNWGGTAPSAGDDLVFSSGDNRDVMNNDYPANTAFRSLTFKAHALFVLSGNGIAIGAGGITLTRGASFNTSTPLTLTASQTWSCDDPGALWTWAIDLGVHSLTVTGNSGTLFFHGNISGTGGLTIGGTAKGLFTGNLDYTGATHVTSGAIMSLSSTGTIDTPFTIANGGTFVVPDGYTPVLSSTLALSSGSAYKVSLFGAEAGQYSEIVASGTSAGVTLAGNLVIEGNWVIPAGRVLTIVETTCGATITGTFAGLPEGALVSSNVQSFLIHYTSTDVTLTAAAKRTQ